jgi:hypothetical protein
MNFPASQNKKRHWTAQKQVTLEVGIACGVSLRQMARLLDTSIDTLNRHLFPVAAEKNRARALKWARENPERHNAKNRLWYKRNATKWIRGLTSEQQST